MATVQLMKEVYFRQNAPWGKNGGLVVCRRPRNPLGHIGTGLAAATFSEAAASKFGGTREEVNMAVAQQCANRTYVRQLKSEVRKMARHAMVGAKVAALRARAGNNPNFSVNGSARSSGRAPVAAAASYMDY
jgi:hypothetical protein